MCVSPACFMVCFLRDKTEMSYQWSNWHPIGFFFFPYSLCLFLDLSASLSLSDNIAIAYWKNTFYFQQFSLKVELVVTGHLSFCIVKCIQTGKNAEIPESHVFCMCSIKQSVIAAHFMSNAILPSVLQDRPINLGGRWKSINSETDHIQVNFYSFSLI